MKKSDKILFYMYIFQNCWLPFWLCPVVTRLLHTRIYCWQK